MSNILKREEKFQMDPCWVEGLRAIQNHVLKHTFQMDPCWVEGRVYGMVNMVT